MYAWLIVVGGFYVLLGVRFLPFINGRQFTSILKGWTAGRDTTEFKVAVDWMWTFGMDLLAIGAVAIIAAITGAPGRSMVVWVIVAREILGGIIPNVWLIARGYTSRGLYAGFIGLHLVIICTGIWAIS